MTLASFRFWLKVSRPGLWFATVWLYILPTSQMDVWRSFPFWYGLFYCCFPLNFLVYGWNDIVDRKIDTNNPRKDSFLFGARGTKAQLRSLWKAIFWMQCLSYPIAIYFGGWKMLGLLIGLVCINAAYNWPKHGLRSKPPWELLCQVGYILVVPFSIWMNDTPDLPWQTYVYLFLFAMQSHLIGEVMDYEPDRQSGRITTATLLGVRSTKLIIIGIVTVEVSLLITVFRDYIFGGFLACAFVWLLLDLLLFFKTRSYTLMQLRLFGYMSNAVALATMIYVWYSGCLQTIPS